jgi:hypothetical protein
MQQIEAREGRPIDEILRGYLAEGLTYDEIGKRLGITKGAVSHWMDRFRVERPRTAA